MLFNSIPFLLFLILVFAGYWLIPAKRYEVQNIFIFISSYVFYAWWDWRFLFLISFSSLIGFFFALWMNSTENDRQRKSILIACLLINLLFLGTFKYFNFFSDSLETLLQVFGFRADFITLDWILPIGISFYTFHNISYIMDVYRRHIQPTRDIFVYLSFMSYFPQLVAGPIQRARDLIPQFQKERTFSYEQAVSGLQQILWGLFKKVVVADNCAVFANQAFAHYETLSGSELIMGTVFFAFQIYGDFSGYTDMALGISKLFGIELTTNFKTPYFASSIPDFWRRWHISLTTWFKDYLYIPLGGNKGIMLRTIFNTLIIFLVSGFWHGAQWTFIVWGLLNALYFIPYLFQGKQSASQQVSSLRNGLGMLFVFILICFSWIFFRAESLPRAFGYIRHIAINSFLPLSLWQLIHLPIFLILCLLLTVEWFFFREKGFQKITFFSSYLSLPLYAGMLLLILMNMSFHTNSAFIYFQF